MTITFSLKITSVNRLLLYVDEDGNTYNDLITKLTFIMRVLMMIIQRQYMVPVLSLPNRRLIRINPLMN